MFEYFGHIYVYYKRFHMIDRFKRWAQASSLVIRDKNKAALAFELSIYRDEARRGVDIHDEVHIFSDIQSAI